MSLLGLCLALVTLLLFFIDLRYLRGPRAPSASFCNLTGAVPCSDEAVQEANRQFRALRRSIVQMVMDACGALGLLLLALYSVRIVAFGKESLSDDELYHSYSLVVWQSICAIFHCGLLDFGDREILFLLYGFNLATLSLAFSPDATLEPFVMIGRVIGSIIFLDLRHGFCINVLFSARRVHLLAFASDQPLGQIVFVQEVCVTICILMIPWAIENIAWRWISALLSANDLGLSLQAVRSVIAMSSDAQGELDKDMRLLQVSPKLAYFFQQTPSSLEGRSFLELVEEDDHQRLQTVLQSAKEMAQQQGKPVPLNLNVSKRNGQHKDLRIHVCSLASERRGPQYFFAMTEVQEKLKPTEPTEPADKEDGAGEAAASSSQPRLTSEALAAHSWAMPVQNTSSLWEVKVQVDEASLEVQEINIILNTNHWKKSRKTYLSECILPGVWDDFKRWIQASLKGRQGTPPFIVPFGFPRIMCAIACARHVELKRKIGSTGRHELSLRLKHIFARRPMTPSVPPPRLSTMSHESL